MVQSAKTVSEPQPAVSGARSNGYAKGRAKREAIIQAAILEFGVSGFHSASLRDIASRAEMSHAGLLHHFPTKVDLLIAVLEHRDEIDADAIEQDEQQGRTWLEANLRLASRNAHRRSIVEMFTILASEAITPTHPAHKYFADRYALSLGRAVESFQDLHRRGYLRPDIDPRWAARTFISQWEGLQLHWLYSFHDPSAERVDVVASLTDFIDSLRTDGRGLPLPPAEALS